MVAHWYAVAHELRLLVPSCSQICLSAFQNLAFVDSSFQGGSRVPRCLLTSPQLPSQMVPSPAPRQRLRIKIDSPVLFSCCAN